ncbi:hypothetical protein MRS44_002004 [Fusarium solani]|uniref:Class I glutamine amidotransferase-like protein n=1 Tax=Fusarium solani TaxID=169388 RepID=A0A9P9GAA8_FUSSL|nr:class I glutamine amidotransferase-like protein [Fusarium solani]KAH7234204.1 class I glutamine amidotransferase-like protein [Fusarium solani]KAJ3471905.1 hypothetical protein MRS44_002004 [Fusarium solani]
MAAKFSLSNPTRPIRVGIVLMNGVTELLGIAPVGMLHGLSKDFVESFPDELLAPSLKAQAVDFKFHWVSEAGEAAHSRLSGGMSILPMDSFQSCPPLDIVLVGAHNFGYTPNAAELAFIRKCWDECSAFLAVCGGVKVPLLAGLLEGKTATGPRSMLGMLRREAPGTNWVERRWARDGRLWTSGALLNGTDLLNAFAHEYWGKGDVGSLVGVLSRMGAWPSREVEYQDLLWKV